jgi:hypothetical protein
LCKAPFQAPKLTERAIIITNLLLAWRVHDLPTLPADYLALDVESIMGEKGRDGGREMRTDQAEPAAPEKWENLEAVITRYQRSPEDIARLAEGHRPFSYKEWQRQAPPATADELAETEEFLRLRNLEREASLAAERGFSRGNEAHDEHKLYRV